MLLHSRIIVFCVTTISLASFSKASSSLDYNKNHSMTKECNGTSLDLECLKSNINAFFLFTMAIMVFFMQAGFALLEAGSVRSKNTVNILTKNLLDFLLGYFVWYAVGWALCHGPGGNSFAGGSEFFAYNMDETLYSRMFNEYVWAANAATIVSGALAERCHIGGYLMYTAVVTGVIYPMVCHWGWGDFDRTRTTEGWLRQLMKKEDGNGWIGYHDFSGSGIVHLTGGVTALVGCIFIGARKGRFLTDDGQLRAVVPIPGHSVPITFIGGFTLMFGFLAFNAGAELTVTEPEDVQKIGRILHTTLAGACSGGLGVLLYNKLVQRNNHWTFSLILNGTLIGVVAQCAGCDHYEIWSSIIIGFVASLVYIGISKAMLMLQLDDPLDAVAVHAGGGLLGVLMEPFFNREHGIFFAGHELDSWKGLGANLLGAFVIIAWNLLWSIPLFWGLKRFKLLRIEGYDEFYGMDLTQHGESAYPASAWDEDQYKDASGRQSGPGPMRQNSKNIEWEENPIHKRRSMESPI